jgi:hypothetical protein
MIKKIQKQMSYVSWGEDKSLSMCNKWILIPCVACALLVVSTAPAYAYIDPGTGSMLVQAIAASVLTAGAMVGVFWKAIKNFFLNIGKRCKDTTKEKRSGSGQ